MEKKSGEILRTILRAISGRILRGFLTKTYNVILVKVSGRIFTPISEEIFGNMLGNVLDNSLDKYSVIFQEDSLKDFSPFFLRITLKHIRKNLGIHEGNCQEHFSQYHIRIRLKLSKYLLDESFEIFFIFIFSRNARRNS